MPTDVTLRTPIYRRQGIIASLMAALVGATGWRLGRRPQRTDVLSDHLRKDIGLPPAPPPRPQIRDHMRW